MQIKAVLNAGDEVVRAVRGRGVDGACSGVHGDVVAQHAEDGPLQERMSEGRVLQLRARERGHFLRLAKIAFLDRLLCQISGHDVDPFASIERDIFRFGGEGHRHRGRQGPRGGCPDDGRDILLAGQRGVNLCGIAGQRIPHPDTGAGVHLVFDFRLGQRSLVVNAPVHRLQALVHQPLLIARVERLNDDALVARVHRRVRLVPATKDADSLELRTLQIEIFLRVLTALLAHRQRVHVELLAPQQIVHFDLDRKSMAVPSGHVRRVETAHAARLHYEVFQRLVERRTQVNGTVGIRWSVVHHVNGLPLMRLADAVVNPHFLPPVEHYGLVPGQVGPHGKVGLGQIQRGFQIERHSLYLPPAGYWIAKGYASYLFIIGSG